MIIKLKKSGSQNKDFDLTINTRLLRPQFVMALTHLVKSSNIFDESNNSIIPNDKPKNNIYFQLSIEDNEHSFVTGLTPLEVFSKPIQKLIQYIVDHQNKFAGNSIVSRL